MRNIQTKTAVLFGGAIVFLGIGMFLFRLTEPNIASSPTQQDTPVTAPARIHGYVMAHDDDPHTEQPFQIARDTSAPTVTTVATLPTQPPLRYMTINNTSYPIQRYQTLMTPNDPYTGQWWETNAKLPTMWDIPRGNHETVLAVIDTGVALQHEEFTNRWYTNAGESGTTSSEAPSSLNCTDRSLPLSASCNLIDDDYDNIVDNETGGATYQNPSRLNCTDQGKPLDKSCNRLDDDGNGYVDDIHGWDFIDYDNMPQAGELNPNGSGTTHGTLVAGMAAASGNNGKGIAGVDWGTKILPIQALDDDGYGDSWSVHRAILYAVARGADVINLSLGSSQPDSLVREAVGSALAAGVTVVAASGNDGCDCMVYPAHYPEVVAVGALNSSSQRASFSSYGQDLDVMAPGTQLTSSTWSQANPTSAYASNANGTSFAAPIVSGLMTRLLSLQPTATTQQLVAAMTESTNRQVVSTSKILDPATGFGALDTQKASQRMSTPYSPTQLYTYGPVSRGGFLSPNTPPEPTGATNVHECAAGTWPSTAIYELKKAGSYFFSISKVEQQNALGLGYTGSLFGYGCLQQPHDRPTTVRTINLFQEFRNMQAPR